jgi:uncharacterized membrane protein YdbT with pleckstrin-like domain
MLIARAAEIFALSTSTPSSLTASITDTLAEPGVLAVIVLVVALPLVFWVIAKIVELFKLEDVRDRKLFERADKASAETRRLLKK